MFYARCFSWRSAMMVELGPWVRHWRLHLGLSEKRLALRAGVPFVLWGLFESGHGDVSAKQLSRAAKGLLEAAYGPTLAGGRLRDRAKVYLAQQVLALLAS